MNLLFFFKLCKKKNVLITEITSILLSLSKMCFFPWKKKHTVQLAKLLLLPSKNEIINVMLFCEIITFSHCKIWCQHMV